MQKEQNKVSLLSGEKCIHHLFILQLHDLTTSVDLCNVVGGIFPVLMQKAIPQNISAQNLLTSSNIPPHFKFPKFPGGY